MIRTLLIGGRGNIGSGLRTYLPRIDSGYHLQSIDLPGAPDKGGDQVPSSESLEFDITQHPNRFRDVVSHQDLVVCLTRNPGSGNTKEVTDLVFSTVFDGAPNALLVASSSVHAIDGLYGDIDEDVLYTRIAMRDPDAVAMMPPPIPAHTPATPRNDYGRSKAYVEAKCREAAAAGHAVVAARWGGINANPRPGKKSIGSLAVWCHQEDAARFVHACYQAHITKKLISGSHYFVVSASKYGIFDHETAGAEVGYRPIHVAEETLEH